MNKTTLVYELTAPFQSHCRNIHCDELKIDAIKKKINNR